MAEPWHLNCYINGMQTHTPKMPKFSDSPTKGLEVDRPRSKSNGLPSNHNASAGPAKNSFNDTFRKIASSAAAAVGSKWAFILSIVIVLVWGLTGPIFHFSDTWQLVINTGTTIVTFLMVFLIQNTQNRDAKAIHLKLDELIRGVKGARTHLVNLEEFSDEELEKLQKQFAHVQTRAERKVNDRIEDIEETADHAHRKAERAEGTSEDAHETAQRAHDAAQQARDAAEDARRALHTK
jgi:low affinity Fe/Cu permease